jgi:hypothetical protein
MNTIKSLLSDASLEFLRQMLNAVEIRFFARSAHFSLNRSQQIEIPFNEIIIQHQHQGSPTQAVKLTSSWLDAGGMGDIYKLEIESQPDFTPNFQLYPDLRVNMRCKIKPNRIYTFGREYSSVIHARDIDFLSKQTIFTGYTLTENQMFNISHESIIWIEQDHYNFLIIKCNFNGFEVTYNDFATQNFLLYLWEDERNERWYRKMRVIE